jgi:hypothetical protein
MLKIALVTLWMEKFWRKSKGEGYMLKNKVLLNITFNTLLAIVFVLSNIWALNMGLEETFVTLAFLYGTLTIIGNALFIKFM